MQISTPIFDDSSAGLVERVRGNRLTLEATALRLSAARSLTEQRLDQTLRLLADVRLAIAVLREHPTGTGPDLRPARPAAALLFPPRSGAAPADPLDVVRQKLHAEYAATA